MPLFGGEDAESYYDEGLTAVVKGDNLRAAQCFERAISLDKSYWAAYHQLAKCYLRAGRTNEGMELLRRVLSKKPDLAPALLDLGFALVELGFLDEARKEFTTVLVSHPENARANLGLAQVCFAEGNWEGALSLAQEARAKGGDHFATIFLLGRAAKLAGMQGLADSVLEEADALLEKSIELSPEGPEGHFLRGEVGFVREQFASAVEQYRAADDRTDSRRTYTAFGEHFGQMDILAKMGLCFQRLGKYDKAREVGERMLKRDPEHKIGQALANLE